jgi:hypothetical protein
LASGSSSEIRPEGALDMGDLCDLAEGIRAAGGGANVAQMRAAQEERTA